MGRTSLVTLLDVVCLKHEMSDNKCKDNVNQSLVHLTLRISFLSTLEKESFEIFAVFFNPSLGTYFLYIFFEIYFRTLGFWTPRRDANS